MDVRLRIEFAGNYVMGRAKVSLNSRTDALQKALMAIGACWGVALITVPIPVIHLVVSPLAFVSGPFVAVIVFIRAQKLPKFIEGSVHCLACSQETAFAFARAKPPLYSMCQRCKTGFVVIWPPIPDSGPQTPRST